jgi:hypothetical protein
MITDISPCLMNMIDLYNMEDHDIAYEKYQINHRAKNRF